MNKISCIAVDDEPLAIKTIQSYIEKTPFLELKGTFSNAIEALEYHKQQPVELLFLDIQMPDLSGMEMSRLINDDSKVIFTTAFEEYAHEGFKVDALDYLLKPFNYEEFLKAATKAREWFRHFQRNENTEQQDHIFIKSEYKLIKVELDKLLYVEGLKDYVKLHIDGATKSTLSLMSMKKMEELLPAARFMRIHRSFIINLDKIDSIEKSRVLIGDMTINVSDSYKEAFNHYLNNRYGI